MNYENKYLTKWKMERKFKLPEKVVKFIQRNYEMNIRGQESLLKWYNTPMFSTQFLK